MSHIIKNNTDQPIVIKDVGITIWSDINYEILPNDYVLWAASEDIKTLLISGDIVYNDGTLDYSASSAILRLKNPWVY